MDKDVNDLRCCCSIIQMQLDVAKEFYYSYYWKMVNYIIRSITPDVKIKGVDFNANK